MTADQGPSGPAEREAQGPSGPVEREAESQSSPAEGEGQPPDLTGPEVDELLRPAAELAIEMAQTGARMQPPLEVPSRLRPLLAHAKVTRAALVTARRAVEEDPGFRARVALAVEVAGAEAALGRAGVLWLSRPQGWEAELGALVAEARAAQAAKVEGAQERSAQRRLRHAEEARDRAERASEDARRTADVARAELQEERRLRRAAEERAERMERRAAAYEEQLAAARRAGEAAADQLAARTDAEAGGVAALAAAEAALDALRAEAAQRRAVEAERTAEDAVDGPSPAGPSDLDRQAVAEAVAAAAAAAAALGTALGRAAAALGPFADAGQAASGPGQARDAGPGRRAATPPRWARPRSPGSRRLPAPLPPLVRDDSAEAADHLVSLPGVSLLVDGYNATLSAWPGLPLPEQRLRLIDALAELAARTGAHPEVVFDGNEAGGRPAPGVVRSLVKVSFTAADVEADDVLIARASALPVPVVVASDDRRVRAGAREAGANILTVDQLLTALRRNP